jgi:tripartite-type tricarboxylate transporter receptor subunit TctC
MKNWTKQNLGNEADIIMGQSPESKYYNKNGEVKCTPFNGHE